MKRIFLTVIIAAFAAAIYGQKNSLDDFFNKYSGIEGYNSVIINGNFFGFLKNFDDDPDLANLDKKVTSIRVLSRKKNVQVDVPDFMPDLRNIIKHGNYEEMITVKNSEDDIRFLVKGKGDIINEILIVASGDDDAVIQIKGNLTQEDVDRISENHTGGIARLEQLESTGK
jgi:hypothetical protein